MAIGEETEGSSDGAERRRHAIRARLRTAALEAEYRTGTQEDTEAKAKRNIFARIGIVVVGHAVLLAGIVMIPLPGPGLVVILAGLGILAQELPWAERMLSRLRKRVPIEQVKAQPTWVRAAMVLATVAAVIASLAYLLMR